MNSNLHKQLKLDLESVGLILPRLTSILMQKDATPECWPKTWPLMKRLWKHTESCFPASGAFPMGQLFTSGGQIIGASGSVLLKYFLNPRFYDFVTWWLRTMFKDWDAFQSSWVWFQALGRLGLSLRAVRGSLGSVRSSEPSTQQLGPSYLCSQEVLVLVFSANWEREESRSFQAFSTLAEKKKYIKVC